MDAMNICRQYWITQLLFSIFLSMFLPSYYIFQCYFTVTWIFPRLYWGIWILQRLYSMFFPQNVLMFQMLYWMRFMALWTSFKTTLNVNWMLTECLLNVNSAQFEPSMNVTWMFCECPVNVQPMWMSGECSRNFSLG